ncbi:protein SAND-like isoform X2 [Halichondria panicea]|uniref:protein SAND-like isoform X2 n=1 Tax=Halichondria panicea TaxID=6063 RepID=UPI00312B7760
MAECSEDSTEVPLYGTPTGDPEDTLTEDTVYNLLRDEDPEEFVTVDLPAEIDRSTTSQPVKSRKSRFLESFARHSSPKFQKRQKSPAGSENSGDILGTSDNHSGEESDSEEKLLSEKHLNTHARYRSPHPTDEEEQSGTVGTGDTFLTDDPHDESFPCSDMLMSMGVTGPEMSVRHSIHIGVSPADLRLSQPLSLPPADENMAKEASRSRIESTEIEQREYEDEDVESTTWCQHQKHVFVLSISGKPVYCRYGKEDKLVNIFGIMQAIVSFFQDDNDNLRSIVAGGHRFVFMCRGPLVLVSISQSGQTDTQLAIQLNYVYYQILSVLTNTQLSQRFEKKPGFDLRYLLQGSEKFIDNILNMTDRDPSFILNGIRCLSMPLSLRQSITSTISQARTKDILFAVLVADDQLVTYLRPKEYNLVPIDIHLILNLVNASMSFRSTESWTPICLPKFNDTGFLHTHVSYLPLDSPACLLLFSTDKEKFFEVQECQRKIVEKLEKSGNLAALKQAVKKSPYNVSDILHAHEVRHFLYKSRKTSCLSGPVVPAMYCGPSDRERLFTHYMFMNQRMLSSTWPTKILYHVGEKEALLGWRTTGFDLYVVFDPLISKTQGITLGNKLIQWIHKNEDKLVITTSLTF